MYIRTWHLLAGPEERVQLFEIRLVPQVAYRNKT